VLHNAVHSKLILLGAGGTPAAPTKLFMRFGCLFPFGILPSELGATADAQGITV